MLSIQSRDYVDMIANVVEATMEIGLLIMDPKIKFSPSVFSAS